METTRTLTDVHTFAMDLVGPARIVAKGFNAAIQVNEERLQKGLPSVQSLQSLENSNLTSINKQDIL